MRRIDPALRPQGRAFAQSQRRTPGGFTLVEALVAIAILGVVAVLAWRATATLTDSEARISGESRRWQQLDAVFARMEADMRHAVPREVRAPAAGASAAAWSAAPNDSAGDTQLVFSRAGPDSIDEPGTAGQRVGYRLRGRRLEVLYWSRLDDPSPAAPAAYTLVDGVLRFRVLQLTDAGAWSARWPLAGQGALPRGVRIELTLDDGGVITRMLALQ